MATIPDSTPAGAGSWMRFFGRVTFLTTYMAVAVALLSVIGGYIGGRVGNRKLGVLLGLLLGLALGFYEAWKTVRLLNGTSRDKQG